LVYGLGLERKRFTSQGYVCSLLLLFISHHVSAEERRGEERRRVAARGCEQCVWTLWPW
jgi:hypothetical protein